MSDRKIFNENKRHGAIVNKSEEILLIHTIQSFREMKESKRTSDFRDI